MGIFLYEIATGEMPYNAKNRRELAKVIAKRKLNYPTDIKLSGCIKDLIEKLIVHQEIDLQSLLEHPFVASE